jgi:peptidoglycan/LPS O-acetylase OafA/YrhL
MYLYGFQIEQMLTTIGAPQLGYTAYAMASLVCTVPLAAASWFAVERRAMRWKARSPVAAQRASGPTDAPNVA